MIQIMIDGELVGGFNRQKEYLLDKGYINNKVRSLKKTYEVYKRKAIQQELSIKVF